MASTHTEVPSRHIQSNRPVAALAALIVAVAVAVAVAVSTLTTAGVSPAPASPTPERLQQLASIYDGQQFGYAPPTQSNTANLERLQQLASIYDGQQFGYAPSTESRETPSALTSTETATTPVVTASAATATVVPDDVTDPREAMVLVDRLIEAWNAQDEEYFQKSATEDLHWSNRLGTTRVGVEAVNGEIRQYMYPPERHIIERVGIATPSGAGSVFLDVDYEVDGQVVEVVWEIRVRDGLIAVLHETAR